MSGKIYKRKISVNKIRSLKHEIDIKLGLDVNKDSNSKILWASPREVLNIYQAKECGCDIITVTSDLYKKYISLANKNLDEYSTETSKMFYDDAKSFNLNVFE